MWKLIKAIFFFALKVLFIAYFFSITEEYLIKFRLWRYRIRNGLSVIDMENIKMERYYRQYGVQCPGCFRFFPIDYNECPLCNTEMNFIDTVNKRMEMRRRLNERN